MSRSRRCPSQSNGITVRDSAQREFCNTIPPESDRLLRCREMTQWAISDQSAVQQKASYSITSLAAARSVCGMPRRPWGPSHGQTLAVQYTCGLRSAATLGRVFRRPRPSWRRGGRSGCPWPPPLSRLNSASVRSSRVRSLALAGPGNNCSYYGGWRKQLEVRFGHDFPPLPRVDCSYKNHFPNGYAIRPDRAISNNAIN